jgi:hypothetical protein
MAVSINFNQNKNMSSFENISSQKMHRILGWKLGLVFYTACISADNQITDSET